MNETQELSEREIEILKLVATGLSNKEIAYQLRISPNTVKVHLKNIFAKINVVSRTEAAMYAVKQGWVEAGFQPLKEENLEEELSQTPDHNPLRLSPLFIGLLGVVGLAFVGLIIFLSLNLADQNAATVIEVVVTPTAEPARWELVTQMPVARKSMAYAAVDNKIYIIGGETPTGITDRVDIYDTVTGQWSEGARKPTPVSEACGAYVGGKIIVAGGRKNDGTVTEMVEIYDTKENRWESLQNLPTPLAGSGCVVFDGSYYLIGGWDGNKVWGDLWQYDINQWKQKNRIYPERAYLSAAVFNETLYFLGGWSGKSELRDIQRYNFYSNNVEDTNQLGLPEARRDMAVINVINNLYIIGGRNSFSDIMYSVEMDPHNGDLREIKNPGEKIWHSIGLVWIGEYIYGFGGMQDNDISDLFYRTRVLYTVILPVINE
jgi:DNA-binding CsgD family transcriptional regulator